MQVRIEPIRKASNLAIFIILLNKESGDMPDSFIIVETGCLLFVLEGKCLCGLVANL